jgi:hypothetical protein
MPLPIPRKNETRNDFISRGMENLAKDYPNQSQRYAIVNKLWTDHLKGQKASTDNMNQDMPMIPVKKGKKKGMMNNGTY